MPELWYPEARRTLTRSSGPFLAQYALKGVLHSTEGDSLTGALATYVKTGSLPHFTVGQGVVEQHYPLDQYATALENHLGGIETNRGGAIQIEIVGHANELPQEETLRNLMMWIEEQTGIIAGAPAFKPYPASYGILNGVRFTNEQWIKFHGWCGHMHVPENCVHPDTPILKSDLTWIRAGDLRPGDELVTFDEDASPVGTTAGRRYRRGVVTQNRAAMKTSYRVTTAQGTVTASADHPWLVRVQGVKRGKRVVWVPSSGLAPGDRIVSIGQPWVVEDSYSAGWLAGALDADGHAFAGGRHGSWIGFGQVDGRVLARFLAEGAARQWRMNVNRRDWSKRKDQLATNPQDFTDVRILGGLWTTIRLLGQLRPVRLIEKATQMWEGAVVGKTTGHTEVISTQFVGLQPVASLTTSTGTFIADGLLCHNTHGDPGSIDIGYLLDRPRSQGDEDMQLPDDVVSEDSAYDVNGNYKGTVRLLRDGGIRCYGFQYLGNIFTIPEADRKNWTPGAGVVKFINKREPSRGYIVFDEDANMRAEFTPAQAEFWRAKGLL